MKRAHVIVSGFVQGVGYRHETRRRAQELGLNGWVRNTVDGNVEAVFESSTGRSTLRDEPIRLSSRPKPSGSDSKSSDQEDKKRLEEMVAWCHKGPYLSEVESVDTAWEETTGEFEDFQIIS